MERKPPLPTELWDQIAPSVQAALRVLLEGHEQRIAALDAEVAELKRQVTQGVQNSSRAPSDEPRATAAAAGLTRYLRRSTGISRSHVKLKGYKWQPVIIVGLAVGISFLLGFNAGVHPVTIGSDESYVYAFNVAAARGLRWGQEFISTYGPYGFLLAPLDVGNHLQGRVIFAFALSAGIGLAVAAYLQSFSELHLVRRIILVPTLVYLVTLQAGDEYRAFCVLILLLLTGLNSRLSTIYLGIGGLLAGFYVLLKFSLGFGALITLAISCILITLWRRLTVWGVLVAAITTTASFIISWIAYSTNVSGIRAYLLTALDISNGYSSAMSFAPPNWWVGVASFMAYALILGIWAVMQRDTRIKITVALLAFPLFVAWKHSVVRQDGHVIIGILFGLFVMGVLVTHAAAAKRTWRVMPLTGVLMILLLIPWFNTLTGGEHPVVSFLTRLRQAASLQGAQYLGFLRDMAGYRQRLIQASQGPLKSMTLPASIRRRIGESSIDVYPWELSFVPANGLHWVTRPLPASYNGYTPTLDRLNAAFLRSARKPEYILWHDTGMMSSIDGRYLLFDEPETVRAIFGNYDLVETNAGVSLLHARSGERWMAQEVVGTAAASWNEWVTVPEVGGAVLAKVSVRPSLAMRLSRELFREGRMTLTVRFASGEEKTFRTVPDNMASGLWISPFPGNLSELGALLQGKPAREVVAVRLNAGFIPETTSSTLDLSWLQLIPLKAESDKAPAAETPVVTAVGDGCAGFIDVAFVERDWYGSLYVGATGWARDGELPIRPNTLWLTDGTGKVLPTEAEVGNLRPDVAKYLGGNSPEQLGWQASTRVLEFNEGNEEIGYIIESRSGAFLRSCNQVRAPRVRKVAVSTALPAAFSTAPPTALAGLTMSLGILTDSLGNVDAAER